MQGTTSWDEWRSLGEVELDQNHNPSLVVANHAVSTRSSWSCQAAVK